MIFNRTFETLHVDDLIKKNISFQSKQRATKNEIQTGGRNHKEEGRATRDVTSGSSHRKCDASKSSCFKNKNITSHVTSLTLLCNNKT